MTVSKKTVASTPRLSIYTIAAKLVDLNTGPQTVIDIKNASEKKTQVHSNLLPPQD
jgi:hypothetical protein